VLHVTTRIELRFSRRNFMSCSKKIENLFKIEDQKHLLFGRVFKAFGTNPRYKPTIPSLATIPASMK